MGQPPKCGRLPKLNQTWISLPNCETYILLMEGWREYVLSVTTRSTLKIKCIDKDEENDSPPRTLLSHLWMNWPLFWNFGYVSNLGTWIQTSQPWGPWSRPEGVTDLLGCCGLSGCWNLAGVTFPSDCHVSIPTRKSAFLALSPGMCCFQFSLCSWGCQWDMVGLDGFVVLCSRSL